MKPAKSILNLTEIQYLEHEKTRDVRHEYLEGHLYAMAGSSATHNLITLALASRLRAHLRGGPCRVFASDMKVRIEEIERFYYPDVVVSCDPSDDAEYYKTKPVLIIEVTSPTTAEIDKREKLLAYQKIASIREYVIVAQDEISLTLYRKAPDGIWWVVTLTSPEDIVELESVDLTFLVSDAYEDVNL